MTDRERNWRSIREAATYREAPEHLADEMVRRVASQLCAGVAPWCDDQAAMGPLPEYAQETEA